VGGAPFLVGVVRDITARKRAEAALQRELLADEMIKDILAGCANCTPDQFDAHMVGALRGLADFLGVDHAYFFVSSPDRTTYDCTHEWCGASVAPLCPAYKHVAAGTNAWLERTLLEGELANLDDAPGGPQDPGRRSLLLVPTRGRNGEFAAALGVDSHARPVAWSDADVMDCEIVGSAISTLTERKRANERLLHEKQFSERLIESLPGLFYLYDADLRLRRWNRNAESLGYTPEELAGMHAQDWFDDEDSRDQAVAVARGILQYGGATDYIESEIRHKDGSLVPYLFSGAHVDSLEGPMIVGVGIDIAARVRAERALAASERKYRELFAERERLIVEAQAASSAKDQFLAVLSHELRNPLAAIQAGVGLLRRLCGSAEPGTPRALDVIERNVKLQARLVDDLLDLSRLVRGKLTIRRAPVQLDEAVLAAVQACRDDAARAEVALETHARSGIWVDADGDRVQQVVINLVGNGIKFTPRGGRVMVSVSAAEGRGLIVVEDTGVGIEAERLPDIFEMFRQGQVAAQRAPGLGIGLALVKSIAELHGGGAWAESAGPGRGSRFTVALPLGDAPTARGAPRDAGPGRPQIKMLLVEDNGDTRTMLAETFAGLAYDVVPAASGEAALDVLAHETVDVIVADIGLPGLDGYELLRRARQLPSAARVPAVALTGYGQEADVRRARDAGYADHFVKPLDAEEIDRRIRARLPLHS
jgi:PAS domain S-box-containing protein